MLNQVTVVSFEVEAPAGNRELCKQVVEQRRLPCSGLADGQEVFRQGCWVKPDIVSAFGSSQSDGSELWLLGKGVCLVGSCLRCK